MSKAKGWIAVYRSIREHWLYGKEPFDKFHAFIDLIFRAQFEDTKVFVKGQLAELKRGQLLVGSETLSEKWQWSRGKVKRFLNMLESEGMIKQNGTALGTVVTIENYSKYQDVRTTDGTTDSTADDTTDSTADGTHINNITIKTIKQKNNKYICPHLGTAENVLLTEEELEKLKERFPYDWQDRIDKLSEYMASKGKRYKSHYMTMLTWARRDEEKKPSKKSDNKFADLKIGRER